MKISKLSFETKFRVVYVANKEVFNGNRIAGIMGALKQFGTMDMNGFKPHKSMKTSRDYWFVDRRVNALRRKIFRQYQHRSMMGGHPILMNIEELASVWHFPVITVKAPLVQKMDAKRGEPPVRLPVGDYNPTLPPESDMMSAPTAPVSAPTGGTPPGNLPTA